MLTRCFRDLHRSHAVLWRLRGLLFSSMVGVDGASEPMKFMAEACETISCTGKKTHGP